MVFVYDYYPGSETLMARHFSHSQAGITATQDPHFSSFKGIVSRACLPHKTAFPWTLFSYLKSVLAQMGQDIRIRKIVLNAVKDTAE
jgi:hypothetical protein